jgi:hypothetical protein
VKKKVTGEEAFRPETVHRPKEEWAWAEKKKEGRDGLSRAGGRDGPEGEDNPDRLGDRVSFFILVLLQMKQVQFYFELEERERV